MLTRILRCPEHWMGRAWKLVGSETREGVLKIGYTRAMALRIRARLLSPFVLGGGPRFQGYSVILWLLLWLASF